MRKNQSWPVSRLISKRTKQWTPTRTARVIWSGTGQHNCMQRVYWRPERRAIDSKWIGWRIRLVIREVETFISNLNHSSWIFTKLESQQVSSCSYALKMIKIKLSSHLHLSILQWTVLNFMKRSWKETKIITFWQSYLEAILFWQANVWAVRR